MVLAPSFAGLFKWRQFEPEVILLAVGWYLRFSLSYRDVEELLAERGLRVDHVTVWRSETVHPTSSMAQRIVASACDIFIKPPLSNDNAAATANFRMAFELGAANG
jgi:hypothetical protein